MFESADTALLALILIGLCYVPVVFYILTLQKAIGRCSVGTRTIEQNSVWLILIPIFNLVYQFIVVSRVSETLGKEFEKRNLLNDVETIKSNKSTGTAYCVLSVCGIIPLLGIIAAIIGMVCWIIFWVKINELSNKLVQPIALQ